MLRSTDMRFIYNALHDIIMSTHPSKWQEDGRALYETDHGNYLLEFTEAKGSSPTRIASIEKL